MPFPTEEQKDIIIAPRSNILVSAAAGSGKTAVLSARITSKIVKKELEIDEMLVATFTNDAAAHMREKIEKSLREALAEEGADRDYIKSQIDKLPGAYIQTMNSFCNRVVNESGHLLDDDSVMNPGSSVLDGTTLAILNKQAAADAIQAVYEAIAEGAISSSEQDDFLNLLFSTGNGKKDDDLIDGLVAAYGKLRALPDYISIIDKIIEVREQNDKDGILIGQDRFVELVDSVIRKVENACAGSEALVDDLVLANKDKDDVKKKDNLRSLTDMMRIHAKSYTDRVPPDADFDEMLEGQKEFFKGIYDNPSPKEYMRLYISKENKNEAFLKAFGPIARICVMNLKYHKLNGDTECPKNSPWGFSESATPYAFNDVFELFLECSESDILKMQMRRTSCSRAFVRLLKDLDLRYAKLKKALRGIDFSDQEHMCLQVLKSGEARSLYKSRFKEIYIDEYQDNTSLQDEIIAQISDNNVFCVGDVKQSIFKFRNANPAMFINKAEKYSSNPDEGKLMELHCNFRSTPQILDFVNEIFSQLMNGGASEIDYDGGNHKLNKSKEAKDGCIPEVVFINANKNKNEMPVEAESDGSVEDAVTENIIGLDLIVHEVKNRVNSYLAEGYKYSDIYVLSRTNDIAQKIAGELKNNGVPSRCGDKTALFKDVVIAGICNLIMLLANTYRDEFLTGVMLSPYRFSNFKLDEIAEIVSSAPSDYLKMNLITKVKYYIENGTDEAVRDKCIVLMNAVDDMRSRSVICDVNDLLEMVYDMTGIKATVKNEDPGELDNLVIFKDWLSSIFLSRGCELTEIASVIEQMQTKLKDNAAFENDFGGEDLVRCMSYHKSKGLEKKCVIVADVDSKGNSRDVSPFVVFKPGSSLFADHNDGPKFFVSDYLDDIKHSKESLEDGLIKEAYSLETLAENMRLLYVALTRAEEKMCFIGLVDLDDDNRRDRLFESLKYEDKYLSRDYYLKCKGIEELMLSALLRMRCAPDSDDLRKACGLHEFDLKYISEFDKVKVSVKSIEDVKAGIDAEVITGTTDSSGASDVKPAIDVSPDLPVYGLTDDKSDDPNFVEYRYKDSMNAPAKTSVSMMKKQEEAMFIADDASESEHNLGINFYVPDVDTYIGDKGGLSGSSLGSAVHKAMRFIDFTSSASDELDALEQEGILSSAERAAVGRFEKSIDIFTKSDIGQAFIKADSKGLAERERQIECAIRINPERNDYELVQGAIDAMYIDDDGEAVIIDYKTDYLNVDDKAEITDVIRKRHGAQLELYAAAVEASGIHVKGRYIYLMRKYTVIEV